MWWLVAYLSVVGLRWQSRCRGAIRARTSSEDSERPAVPGRVARAGHGGARAAEDWDGSSWRRSQEKVREDCSGSVPDVHTQPGSTGMDRT